MSETPKVHHARPIQRPSATPTSLDGFQALGFMVQAARECVHIYQSERSKRARLETYERTEIARIKAAENTLRTYFEGVFAERRNNFEHLFVRLDTALEQQDGEAVSAVVRGIVDIARTSPLADLGDLSQIRAALDDPDQVWDL